MNRRASAVIISIFLSCILFPACGRHKLRYDEIERNRLFATILEREDRRTLGNDDFFKIQINDSPYPEVREWCALALGRIGCSRGLPLLSEACRSPYAGVRAAAAFAIGKIEERDALRREGRHPEPRAARELANLLADPSLSVRLRVIEALGRSGSAGDALKITGQLESVISEDTPEARAFLDAGITALMRLKEPSTYPLLRRLGQIEHPEIQWRALNALARVGDRSACPDFQRLLRSRHAEVRFYAARGIGICDNPMLSNMLLPLLPPFESGNGNPVPLGVRAAALQSLGNLRSTASVPAIRAALGSAPISDDNPDQANFAIQAASTLGSIRGREAEAILIALLRIRGPVADAAVVALAKTMKDRPDRFFEVTGGISTTEPAAVRAWARALGELGGDRAILALKQALIRSADDHAPYAAVLAVPTVIEALAKAGAPDLEQILPSYLSSHDGVVLRAAIAAYKPGPASPSPWAPVLKACTDVVPGLDTETKVAVIDRLEPWIREAEVQSGLRTMLRDRERNARIAAARLLRMADAQDIPDDPGPAEVNTTPQTYQFVSSSRKDRPVAILETTRGEIEFELFMEDAPMTSANFISLARRGFFDGLSFMRVVPNFVIQGGDPRNDQEGGPGYAIRCEINMRPYERGSVGMALAGKDTGGSQFFITMSPQPHLDGGYTCFGRVISGMPVVDHMLPGDRIIKVRIEENVTAFDYHRF